MNNFTILAMPILLSGDVPYNDTHRLKLPQCNVDVKRQMHYKADFAYHSELWIQNKGIILVSAL